MVKATWNDTVIAESDATVVVDGNHYFPREAVNPEVLSDSTKTSFCPWKGTAHYHNITVDGATNNDAAWYYPDPQGCRCCDQGSDLLLARSGGRVIAEHRASRP